jgi:hypothetical protein
MNELRWVKVEVEGRVWDWILILSLNTWSIRLEMEQRVWCC